jgi:chromosome segregation ATPase
MKLFCCFVLLLFIDYPLASSVSLVYRKPFRPYTTFSLFFFRQNRISAKESLEITQNLLDDSQQKVKDLQLILFSAQSRQLELKRQLVKSKETIQSLRKEKVLLRLKYEKEIIEIKEQQDSAQKQLIEDIYQEKEEEFQELLRKAKEDFEEERKQFIESLNVHHESEINQFRQRIQQLEVEKNESLKSVEELKKKFYDEQQAFSTFRTKTQVAEVETVKVSFLLSCLSSFC